LSNGTTLSNRVEKLILKKERNGTVLLIYCSIISGYSHQVDGERGEVETL
jgi:hypothetical protein